MNEEKNDALKANEDFKSEVEKSMDFIERFDILETINNVGNDEVFTPVKTCQKMLDILPKEVWNKPDYKWLNPCDKNGVFLREIALRLDKGLRSVPGYEDNLYRRKHIMTEMLYSIGLTKFTALVSRRTNYYCSSANRKPDGEIDNDGHYKNGYAIGRGEWFDTEEGNILTPTTEHDFVDGKCKYCRTAKTGRYTDSTQNEHYAYEFIHVHHLELQKHLQNRFFKGDKNMKFDIIIGNPPYSLNYGNQGGNDSKSGAIYDCFISNAIALNPKYICMIIPSRWMTKNAEGIKPEWVDSMLKSHKFRFIHDFQDANECFPSRDPESDISLKGGCDYFLWDRDYDGTCEFHYHPDGGDERIRTDFLDPMGTGILIRDPDVYKVIEKIIKVEGSYYNTNGDKSFYSLVSGKDFFTDHTHLTSNWRGYSKTKDNEHPIKYYISEKTNGVPYGWINSNDYVKNKESQKLNKVYIPAASGNGMDRKVISNPFYGEPGSVCSQTFLVVGYDPIKHNFSKEECLNIISYMKTKFFRYLVSIVKKTQNGSRNSFQLVPVLDFSRPWTDSNLYQRYNLSQEEIDYIEEHIQEMD